MSDRKTDTTMTDPVDTDELRTPYDHFPYLRQAYSEGFERAHVEVDRLRTVVESAPHANACNLKRTAHWGDQKACDCWKADAL